MAESIYFDTNQIYYIRRIADEAEGFEYGDYSWAYDAFPNNPEIVADIKALCYIISLQYQWDLEFYSSDASYTELIVNTGKRALETRKAWEAVGESNLVKRPQQLVRNVSQLFGTDSFLDRFGFIQHEDDRAILSDFVNSKANVLLTSDSDILAHKVRLAGMGINVMRPSEWINKFLENVRGKEDGVHWVERILFTIGSDVGGE